MPSEPEYMDHPGPEAATANHAIGKMALDDPFVLDSRFRGPRQDKELRIFAASQGDNGAEDADFALMLEEFSAKHPYERTYREGVPVKEMEAAKERRRALKAMRPTFEEFNGHIRNVFKELQRRHCRISQKTRILLDLHWDRNQNMELELHILKKTFEPRR